MALEDPRSCIHQVHYSAPKDGALTRGVDFRTILGSKAT